MHYTLPILPYSYDSLEPFIDTETMKIHHLKHHQTYINNLNNNIKNINFQNISIEMLLTKLDDIDIKYRNIIKNNAGGHINHTFFWKCLKNGTILSEELKKIIEIEFISINNFKSIFEEKAMQVFGSGWIWLLYQNKKLIIHSTINQDNPLMGLKFSGTYGYPIFGLDLWEHAYYLKYQNRRLNYIKSFWNIINWDVVLKNIKKYYIN